MFVIAGVSGRTGAVAAETLLGAKQKVRVLARSAEKAARFAERGAEVSSVDLENVDALTQALRGAAGAYLLLPPFGWTETGFAERRKAFAQGIVDAVKAARPAHVVLLSSVGAQHEAGTGPIASLNPIERGLAASGVPSTFLRAAYFQENWAASIPGALEAGALYNGLSQDLKFSQVATRDIGRMAAKLLLEPVKSGTRTIELAGPEEYSLEDTARLIGKVAKKDLKAVSVPLEAMKQALMGMGASSDVADLYVEMTGALNAGKVAWEGGKAQLVRGDIGLEETLRGIIS
ncbi:MAG: NmrA family NAD(P)-binding protein [Polyangiaceae bacterium]